MRLPDQVDAMTLGIEAAKAGVLIEPGDVFFMSEKPPGQYVRLGYQSIPASAIDEGVQRLAQVIDRLLKYSSPRQSSHQNPSLTSHHL